MKREAPISRSRLQRIQDRTAPRLRRLTIAGLLGATFSGLPSTTLTVIRGGDVFAATRAASTLIPGRRDRPLSVVAGVVAHVAISAWWTAVLAAVDRRHRLGPAGGAAAGLGIAALDLGLIGRRYPAIRSLPQLPQWLDHVAFGAIVGAALTSGRSRS